MNTIIYYFSGTGNSLQVAKDLKAQLEDSKLVSIAKGTTSSTEEPSVEKIGFIFPIYFNGIPLIVKRFVENLKVEQNTYIFAVATYGGSAGIAFNQIDDILKKKGTFLSAGFGLAMPGNYQVMYDVYSKEKQEKWFIDEKEQIVRIASSIKNHSKSNRKATGMRKAVGGMLYRTFKPREKDKNFWTTEKCNGCETCSRLCPVKNIEMTDGKPKWKHGCELCLACMQWCPQKSIQYKKGTLKRGRYHHPDVKVNELF